MTMKRSKSEQLKAVPDPLENQQRAARKPERETYNVYRLPSDDDDANAEKEFLLTLPLDVDVERRIKRDYGAGSYRVERRRAGRFVSFTEMHFGELPRHEDINEREGNAGEDLEERLAPMIAQVVEDVLEARRVERERTKALRPNPSSRTTMQTIEQAPDPVGDALRLLREFKALERETAPPAQTKSEPTINDEDRALMMLLKDRGMRSRITSSLFSLVGNGDGEASAPWYGQLLNELTQRPALAERLLDRIFPNKKKASAESGDDEPEEPQSAEDVCADYLMEKCAANEPVTLNDEPLRALAVSSPSAYQELVLGLQAGSVDQIIAHLSEQFEGARFVLRTPHARGWIEQLKEIAAVVV
jgi:hypothetical protein